MTIAGWRARRRPSVPDYAVNRREANKGQLAAITV